MIQSVTQRLIASLPPGPRRHSTRRWTLAVAVILGLTLLFALRPGSTSASPGSAPGLETRETIIAIAEEMAYGQWTSPVSVTRNTAASPIRWGTFNAGQTYAGQAYTQQNPQESWATFLANMNAKVGTPGVDQGTDCSGFASFAWQIPRQSSSSFISSGSAYALASFSDLIRGDGLLLPSQHIAIYYDRLETGNIVVLHQTDPQARQATFSWAYASTYTPIRRVNVADDNASPTAPSFRAPTSGAIVVTQPTTFEWAASPTIGVDAYRIRVATDAAKLSTGPWVVDQQVSATTYTTTFPTYGDYYWLVQACKGCATGTPAYSTNTASWKVSYKAPSTYWKTEHFSDEGLTTPCHSEQLTPTPLFKDWPSGGPGGSCPADGFGARLSRRVTFQTGHYTFALAADDKARLYLDDMTTPIIDAWNTPSSTTLTKELDLTAGEHTLKVEYYDVSGLARLYAYWSGPGFDLPREAKDSIQWYTEYWPNKDVSGDSVARKNEGTGALAKSWGSGGPGYGFPSDLFSARFERTVYFPCGLYRFDLSQDDGARVYVDGSIVPGLDHWSVNNASFSANVRLSTGNHVLKVVYFENAGDAKLSLDWTLLSACPQSPSSPSPSAGQVGVSLSQPLSWVGGDPENEVVTYSVNMDPAPQGSTSPVTPKTRVCQATGTSCDPLPGKAPDGSALELSPETHYYWQVEAQDSSGNVTKGPVFDFVTAPCQNGEYRAEYFKGALPGTSYLVRCESPVLGTGPGSTSRSLYQRDWGTSGPRLVTPWTAPGGLGGTNYSVVLEGLFDFPSSLDVDPTHPSLYGLFVTSDDGVRVYLDGSLVLDGWRDQAPTSYRSRQTITPGENRVRVEYYQATGGAVLKVGWSGLRACEGLTAGQLCVEHFGNRSLEGAPSLVSQEALTPSTPLVHEWGGDGPSGLPADNFSALYEGKVLFEDGSYQFTATADDGVTVYLDGELVLSGWKDQAPTTYRATRAVAAGEHDVRVEFYEAAGGATLRVSVVKYVDPCSGQLVGEYCAQYYNGSFDSVTASAGIQGTPVLVRRQASPLSYDFGTASPDPKVSVDHFGARWQGHFPFEDGSYTFTVTADDGLRLWVDGSLIVDQWKTQAPTTYKATWTMTAGEHDVRVEYFESTGGAVAKVSWAKGTTTARVEKIVDDQSSGFTRGGSSWQEDSLGYLTHKWWATSNGTVVDCWGEWRADLEGGSYEVFVYVPRYNTTSLSAKYMVYHQGGTTTVSLNLNSYIDQWVSLGTYSFASGVTRQVRLTDATGETADATKLAFDAVRFTPR